MDLGETLKPFVIFNCCPSMTKPANNHKKPSPADTPTDTPTDNGHKSVVKKQDKQYHADEPEQEDIATKHEKEEQPVESVKS
jgi:hypothetical protein